MSHDTMPSAISLRRHSFNRSAHNSLWPPVSFMGCLALIRLPYPLDTTITLSIYLLGHGADSACRRCADILLLLLRLCRGVAILQFSAGKVLLLLLLLLPLFLLLLLS